MSGILRGGFGDSVDFGLVTVGYRELSCDGGLIEGMGIEAGTSSDREEDVEEVRA